MKRRGLGWLKDRPKLPGETPDFTFAAHAASLGIDEAVPASANLDNLVLSVLDQGQLGSCVANGTLQALRMRQVAQGISDPKLGSRLMLYYLARAVDHATAIDSGTYPRTAIEMLNKFGFCPEELWPYSDKNDTSPSDPFKRMPPMEAFREAFDQHLPTKYVRITSTGNTRLTDMKRAISSGFPIIFGCDVSNEFCQGAFNAKEPLTPPSDNDIAGGHCMLFGGYDGDNFRVVNSWSEDFGDRGRVTFAPEYVAVCSDLWIIEHAPVEGEV